MWKRYRMWFGAGYAMPECRIRQEPPYSLHKEMKPTRMVFSARTEQEASDKVHKFMIAAEVTGVWGVEEIRKERKL